MEDQVDVVQPTIEESKVEEVQPQPVDTTKQETELENHPISNTTVISNPPKPRKFLGYPLSQVGMNQYRSETGSMYSYNDNGSLIKINKRESLTKKQRARLKRLAKQNEIKASIQK